MRIGEERSRSLIRRENVYAAICQLAQQKNYPVLQMCPLVGVSRSAYYSWLHKSH
ncbi:MAG: hypothetical protein ACOX74_06005 [Lachnospiraceae bacterium]|jgi:hypothetical protein